MSSKAQAINADKATTKRHNADSHGGLGDGDGDSDDNLGDVVNDLANADETDADNNQVDYNQSNDIGTDATTEMVDLFATMMSGGPTADQDTEKVLSLVRCVHYACLLCCGVCVVLYCIVVHALPNLERIFIHHYRFWLSVVKVQWSKYGI